MDYDPDLLQERDATDFERIAEIKETSLALIQALKVERDSDIDRTLLYFDVNQDYFIDNLPSFITQNIGSDPQISQFWIDATVNRLTGEAEFGLYSNSEALDGETTALGVTVSACNEDLIATDVIIGEYDMPVHEVAIVTELNRYLAGLFVKNKTGDYSAFDKMDLTDPKTLGRLIEALAPFASEVVESDEYYLSDYLSHVVDSIKYIKRNDTVHSAEITIEHHGKASTFDIELEKPEFAPDINYDEKPEFVMQSLDGLRVFTLNVNGEREQVPTSNDRLRVLISFLTEKTDSVFVKPQIEALDENYDVDESLTLNVEDSKF